VERSAPNHYTVFWADDMAETGISQESIARSFELTNHQVTWELDPHEKQLPEHTQALAQILR
jgi:hypothetical protein